MTEEPRILKATFEIPKKNFKSSNMAMGHIVAAQKSAWIRQFAGPVWEKAVEDQFGITPVIPTEDQLESFDASDEVQEVIDQLDSLDNEVKNVTEERKLHDGKVNSYKKAKVELRELKKDKTGGSDLLIVEKELEIAEYETKLDALKASQKRLKSTLAAVKKRHGKDITKELRRIDSAKRRDYLAKKLELNSHQQLFTKCAVVITAHNISKHLFDAPNFYPTVKPILDAATDSGVIWADDNNTIISGGVLFQAGEHLSRENYTIDIQIVSEWPWAGKYIPRTAG